MGREDSVMAIDLTDSISVRGRVLILAICGAAMAVLILCERYLGPSVPLGALFFLPLFVASAFVPRWTIFLIAIAMVYCRERFGPFPMDRSTPVRVALGLVAFTGGALFAGELIRNRKITLTLLQKTREEAQGRAHAAQEIRALIESSPAAVLTVDADCRIAMSNAAARRLLGFSEGSPEGHRIENYIPLLARLLKSKKGLSLMGTMVEASGHRRDGEPFYAQMWLSSYDSAAGPRLAVLVSDVTEYLRDREESGLRQLLSSSRIIAGAVSHEIRNLTGAAAVLHHNLSSVPVLRGNVDFEALGKVIESVLKLSTGELEEDVEEVLEGVDVPEIIEELTMIITPSFDEVGARIESEIAESLPRVRVNHSGLLQVFINLARNSGRALQGQKDGLLRIVAYQLNDTVVVRFADNGPGISAPDRLFQPFHAGASATGLGLFISRAVIRTFGGELHHTQRPGECSFIVELPAARAASDAASA